MREEQLFEWKVKRMKKKITLTEIGQAIGVSKSYLSSVENGHKKPTANLIASYKHYIESK